MILTTEERLKNVFADVFEMPIEEISSDMCIKNTAAWDSMQTIVLSSSVESEFDMEFTDEELVMIDSFENILTAVKSRQLLRP